MSEQDLDWEFVRNDNCEIPDSNGECLQAQFRFRRISNIEDCKYAAFKIRHGEPRDWYTAAIKKTLVGAFPSDVVERAMQEFVKTDLGLRDSQ